MSTIAFHLHPGLNRCYSQAMHRTRRRAMNITLQATGCSSDVLQWLVKERHSSPGNVKISVQQLERFGRGLVATEDAAPGEVLLSVPFTTVFMDTETDESSHLPWSARMGMRLLHLKHGCDSGHGMHPWVEALPAHVQLPILDFSREDVAACQDADATREAAAIHESALASAEDQEAELAALGCGWEELRWAMSVLHSRCFTLGGPSGALVHLTVPGIDMANHSFQPNASVRVQHSPDAVQGRHASEEVCKPAQPAPSRFELIAGVAGIRAGEEVTISYGAWSNEVFYLFFGFLPEENPWDAALLFRGVEDLVQVLDRMQDVEVRIPACSRAEGIEAALREQHGIADWRRLVAVAGGFDRRTVLAAKMALGVTQRLRDSSDPPVSCGEFLARRCQELLNGYPTSLEQDMELLEGASCSQDMALSVRYRMAKKRILLAAAGGQKHQ